MAANSLKCRADMDTHHVKLGEPPEEATYLLNLPRELRDMIWKYALAEDDGLALDPTNSNFHRTAFQKAELRMGPHGCSTYNGDENIAATCTELREMNQLRYVCRQLYQETNGLSFGYPVIQISAEYAPNDGKSSEKKVHRFFNIFRSSCSPAILDRLRRIVIYDTASGWPDDLHLHDLECLTSEPLVSFCENRPHVNVIIRFNWLDLWAHDDVSCLLINMAHLAVGLQRSYPFPLDFQSYDMEHGLFCFFSSVDCPENLRFSITHYLGPRSVELSLREYGCAEEDMEMNRKTVQEIWENGI